MQRQDGQCLPENICPAVIRGYRKEIPPERHNPGGFPGQVPVSLCWQDRTEKHAPERSSDSNYDTLFGSAPAALASPVAIVQYYLYAITGKFPG